MPEDLKLSQIDSSQLLPPFRVVRNHCQIIFACYFRKMSIVGWLFVAVVYLAVAQRQPIRVDYKVLQLLQRGRADTDFVRTQI